MSESADYTHRKYGMQQPSSAKELLSFRCGNEPFQRRGSFATLWVLIKKKNNIFNHTELMSYW